MLHKNLSEPVNAHGHINKDGCLHTDGTDVKSRMHQIDSRNAAEEGKQADATCSDPLVPAGVFVNE